MFVKTLLRTLPLVGLCSALCSCGGLLGIPFVPIVQNQENQETQPALTVQRPKAGVTQQATKLAETKAEPKRKLIAGKYVVRSTQRGKMSWYSVKTNGGTKTASGERFSDSGMTAAHRTLKFGTRVRVTNQSNGKQVILRITDRGPFIKGRIIDVSIGAARKLGFVKTGVTACKVEVLKTP
ncbi:MAG: septal ring lytic transglycosylase RlpA family protein [Verrucomicrobiota bacterium JB023]|nr:septal ring lytic transglycosylase RlpA family protein [Verrucomicrobiota bacterium JB023]